MIATIARSLSDFRTVGTLTVPYRVEATIDGVASPDLSYSIVSIDIDPAIDAAAIARPLESQP